jgi:hypothetical protein
MRENSSRTSEKALALGCAPRSRFARRRRANVRVAQKDLAVFRKALILSRSQIVLNKVQ